MLKHEKIKKIKLFGFLFMLYILTTNAQAVSPADLTKTTFSDQVLIFVSSSMPTNSLMQWFVQAQQIKAPIVLRGFIKNSLQETQAWLKPLSGQIEHFNGIEINPMAFEAYGITQVPAVVVTTSALKCTNEKCQAPIFDVIYGNTNLDFALKKIYERHEKFN